MYLAFGSIKRCLLLCLCLLCAWNLSHSRKEITEAVTEVWFFRWQYFTGWHFCFCFVFFAPMITVTNSHERFFPSLSCFMVWFTGSRRYPRFPFWLYSSPFHFSSNSFVFPLFLYLSPFPATTTNRNGFFHSIFSHPLTAIIILSNPTNSPQDQFAGQSV